jgi:GDP-L-fucose synthase
MNILVAGHKGMVGSAIVKHLYKDKSLNIITADRSELNLISQKEVENFFDKKKIDQVYLAAAKVGGIHANNEYPAEFIYENLMIQANVIHSAHIKNVQKVLFLGSSCIYPKHAKQPMDESSLLTGSLEKTNEPYAVAKIAGIKLCESYNRQYGRDFRSVMPTNLYGENDNFHEKNSHVIPAMIRRFHNAVVNDHRKVVVWGSGMPMREFLHVDDMAMASIFLMNLGKEEYNSNVSDMCSHVNIGSGVDCTIKELAETIAAVTKYNGKIIFDKSMPDGAPRKLMNITRLNNLGWEPSITLEKGLQETYKWFKNNIDSIRK